MKWVNHEIVTGVALYAAEGSLLIAAIGMAGAVIPDKLEGHPGNGSKSYWRWRSRHRGWSHWLALYLLLAGLLWKWDSAIASADSMAFDLAHVLFWLAVGAILHVLEDGICGKIPILSPWGKHGLKLFDVGSVTEYLFSIVLVLLCYFFGSLHAG